MTKRDAFIARQGQTVTLPDAATEKMLFDERLTEVERYFSEEIGREITGRVAIAYAYAETAAKVGDQVTTARGVRWRVQGAKDLIQADVLLCRVLLMTAGSV